MANEGEERLLTLFGDIHYWFCPPSPRPASHRFDRESYVYLYYDAAQHRGRIEIANHAGTPEQDAFTGYLDNSKISQSHRQPSLVTVEVDGAKAENPLPSQSSDWRLPSTDPRDEGKYLFRLHALDLYFWTPGDAALFVRSAQHCLRNEQLDIDYPAPTPHTEVMSPVVQQLENVAISDPAYQNGKTRNSATTSSTQPTTSANPATSTSPSSHQDKEREQKDYTPLAYNPAAPPAPEARAHREKTPPPPEAAAGTGLTDAAREDLHPQQPHPSYTPSGALPPPPSSTQGISATQAYTGAPPSVSPGSHYSLSSPPSHTSTAPSSTMPPQKHNYIPSAIGPPSAAAAIHAAASPSSEPLDSPTSQILGRSYLTSPTQPLQHLQPHYADYLSTQQQQQQQQQQAIAAQQSHHRPSSISTSGSGSISSQRPPPIGGYSDYDYSAAQAAHSQAAYGGHAAAPGAYYPTGTGDYGIHSQVYRPTEEEVGGKPVKEKKSKQGKEEEPAGKWEQKAERAEKGLNRLLRKVEKKIG